MAAVEFEFYRTPLAHQRRDFERFKDDPYFALFYEQRARKTKVVLDIFRYRCMSGSVDALVVLAHPNGVHRIWLDELPKDLPPEFLERARTLAWRRGLDRRVAGQQELDALVKHPGPIVLTMFCDSILSEGALKLLRKLFTLRKIMLIADESSWMARFSKRTKKMLQIGKSTNAIVKAILDGTPVDEGPVDLWYPTKFLKPGLLGFSTKEAFKARYITYEESEEEITQPDGTKVVIRQRAQKINHNTGATYFVETGTQNLDDLHGKLAPWSSRVLRSEVSDAPPKTYQTRYFQLTPTQREVYDTLRKRYVAELSTGSIPVINVLTRMTRLQMVARNYYPPEKVGIQCTCAYGYLDTGDECPLCDGLGVIVKTTDLQRIDEKHNPAAEALVQELEVTRYPAVVWCRFRQDVVDAVAAARDAGRNVLQYDGSIPERQREEVYQAYKASTSRHDVIIATLASGLTKGKDLSRAGLLCYYSNDFARRIRSQSEDRAEGLDNTESTDIVDLVAEDTRDIDIINALREKKEISRIIMDSATALL